VVTNPRIAAGSTVVSYWLRLLRCTKDKKHHEDLKNLLPALDIGSHSNARPELLPEAGAQRTLEAVSSRPSDTRLHAITHATPLTTAAGVIAPQALFVQALMAQLRALLHAMADCNHARAHRAQEPPDCPWLAVLPGAVFAPRLLVACGAQRARDASADARQKYAGIAPVTERRGTKTWVHGRWQCPTCLRPTCVAWAAASMRHSFGARADSQPQRDQGTSHQAAVRALAFTWLRLLLRCWQQRTPYNASTSLSALKRRGSPLLHTLANVS
jgi:hypothetical protein